MISLTGISASALIEKVLAGESPSRVIRESVDIADVGFGYTVTWEGPPPLAQVFKAMAGRHGLRGIAWSEDDGHISHIRFYVDDERDLRPVLDYLNDRGNRSARIGESASSRRTVHFGSEDRPVRVVMGESDYVISTQADVGLKPQASALVGACYDLIRQIGELTEYSGEALSFLEGWEGMLSELYTTLLFMWKGLL